MNIVVNSSEEFQIENIEGEILSTNGRVRLLGLEVPPYPKLLHLSSFSKEMVVQKKINGYNVRLVYFPKLDNFLALLRGGYVCSKTTFMLRKLFRELFMNFFKDNPKKILCMEVLGRKTLANLHIDYYQEKYSFKDAGYFVFDIMDMDKKEKERFFSFESVKETCQRYDLQLVPVIGVFNNIEYMNKKLQEISPVFEGAVVKSLDGREILKYRFDERPELFADKIPEREKREKTKDEVIVAHFFQGYEEKELGLNNGINQGELEAYQKMVDEMKDILLKDKGKIGKESKKIVKFLMDTIQKHGDFDEKTLEKIEKRMSQKVGDQVGKILRMNK